MEIYGLCNSNMLKSGKGNLGRVISRFVFGLSLESVFVFAKCETTLLPIKTATRMVETPTSEAPSPQAASRPDFLMHVAMSFYAATLEVLPR